MKSQRKMNNRGEISMGAIVGILFVILLFVGLILIIIIVGQKSDSQDEKELNQTVIFYMESLDAKTKARIESQYLISHEGFKLSEGNLIRDSLTELEIRGKFNQYEVFCWGDNNYLEIYVKKPTKIEDKTNTSKVSCNLQSHGNLAISQKGDLGQGTKTIILNVTAKGGEVRKLSAVLKWSSGIINVKYDERPLSCEEGTWISYQTYLESGENKTWHQRGFYSCGGILEKCTELDESKKQCFLNEEKIPNRYLTKVDKAIYIGINLKDKESAELTFEVTSRDNINTEDFLEIIFYDKELKFLGDRWEFLSEAFGENIGNPQDFTYLIEYEG